VNYRVSKDSVVSFTLDVFNLFNFQGVDQVDQTYTTEYALPLKGGKASDIENPVGVIGWQEGAERDDDPSTPNVDESQFGTVENDVNKNFKNPSRYQPPRQVRFGIRYTF